MNWFNKKKSKLPSVLEKIEEHDGFIYILIKGVNDKTTIPADQSKWDDVVNQYHMEEKHIIFDMGHVTEIDTAALVLILNALNNLKVNQQFILVNATEQFLNLADIQKVQQKMRICQSLEEAKSLLESRNHE